jgi:hypothetical protein
MVEFLVIAAVLVFGFIFYKKQQSAHEENLRHAAELKRAQAKDELASSPKGQSFNPNTNARDAAAFARSLQMSPDERSRRARGLD